MGLAAARTLLVAGVLGTLGGCAAPASSPRSLQPAAPQADPPAVPDAGPDAASPPTIPWAQKALVAGGAVSARFQEAGGFLPSPVRTSCGGASLTSVLGDEPGSTYLLVPRPEGAPGELHVLRSDGGAFSPWASLPIAAGDPTTTVDLGDSCPLTVRDLDGDGRFDIAVAAMRADAGGHLSAILIVFFNQGGGVFQRVEVPHDALDGLADQKGIIPTTVAAVSDPGGAWLVVGWKRGQIPNPALSTRLSPLGNVIQLDLVTPLQMVPPSVFRVQGTAVSAAGSLSSVAGGHVYAFGAVGRSGPDAPPGLLAAVDFSDQGCFSFAGGVGTPGAASCGAIGTTTYANGMGLTYIPEAAGYGAFIPAIGGIVQLAFDQGIWSVPPGAPLNRRRASKQWSWKPLPFFLSGRRALLVMNQFAEEGLLDDTFESVVTWESNIPSSLDSSRQQGTFHTLLVDEGATVRELHVPGVDIAPGAGGATADAMDIDGDGEPEIAFTVADRVDPYGGLLSAVHIGHLAVTDEHGVPWPAGHGLSIRLASPAPGARATATCGGVVVVDELLASAGLVGPPSTELLLGCRDAQTLTDLTVTSGTGAILLQAPQQSLGKRLLLP